MQNKMILTFLGGLLVSGAALAEPQAGDDGSDPDACGAALCLIGQIRDDDCNKYIDQYFDIEKYKHGHFSPSRTKEARGKWLNECKDDTEEKRKANDIWGPVQRGF